MLGIRGGDKAHMFVPSQNWQSGMARDTSPQAWGSVLRRGRYTVLGELMRGTQPEFGALVRASSLRSDLYAES